MWAGRFCKARETGLKLGREERLKRGGESYVGGVCARVDVMSCHVVFSRNAGHCRAVCGCQCRGWRDVCGVAGMAAGPVRSSSCAPALRACRREHCGLISGRAIRLAAMCWRCWVSRPGVQLLPARAQACCIAAAGSGWSPRMLGTRSRPPLTLQCSASGTERVAPSVAVGCNFGC